MKLKPCPNEFCKSTCIGVSGTWHSIKKHYSRVDRLFCNDCGASLKLRYVTMEEAIEAWNTRPLEQALKAHVLEVLAKQISRTYRDGYDSDYKYMRDKDRYVMSQEDWDSKCRAEARALLGWDNENNDKEK